MTITRTRTQVEALVTRIQGEFLDRPHLRLTVPQAARRFGLSTKVCEPVLQTLADARVLAVTPGGAFERFYPKPSARASHSRAA